MGLVAGQKAYQQWKKGDRLTRQEAIEAQCYVCNGGEVSYCGGEGSCSLYGFSQFSHEALRNRAENAEILATRKKLDLQKVGVCSFP